MIITNPGLYPRLPFAEYGSIPAHSPSRIISGRVSMLEYDYRRTHQKEATPAMRFGSAIHCSVLEPDAFPLRYCIWTGGTRRGNKFDEFCAANIGKDVLSADEYQTCLAARDAARAHPLAGPILAQATPDNTEVSLVWNNPESELLCKGRPDLLLDNCVYDLKTTTAHIADTRALTRIASTFGYHISLAAYQEGISIITGEVKPFKIIFVEQDPPHDVRVMNVPGDVLGRGWDEWQRLLSRIAECRRTGVWPGCSDTETDLTVWHDDAEFAAVTLDGEAM